MGVAAQLDMLVMVVVTGTAVERLVNNATRRMSWKCMIGRLSMISLLETEEELGKVMRLQFRSR